MSKYGSRPINGFFPSLLSGRDELESLTDLSVMENF
jgi:hypothetical protein